MEAITTIGFDIAKSVLLMLAAKWLFAGSWIAPWIAAFGLLTFTS